MEAAFPLPLEGDSLYAEFFMNPKAYYWFQGQPVLEKLQEPNPLQFCWTRAVINLMYAEVANQSEIYLDAGFSAVLNLRLGY